MENQNIEYKEQWRDEYLKWVCGFANAQGGKIFIGIDDNGNVVGVNDVKKLMEDIPNKVRDVLGIIVDVNLLSESGKDFICVNVNTCSMPLTYHGKYYYRSGSTLQELGGASLNDFIMRKMNTTWDSTIHPNATLNDIDDEALSYFKMKAIRSHRLDENVINETTEMILRRLHLLNDDGKLTYAALLVFGKDIEKWNTTAAFRIGRFGVDASDLKIQDSIVCPLIMMPDRIMDVLRSKYLVSPIHYEGLQRVENLEIPEDALREMLCNAIVHKDYLDTFIQMRVWSDRITIWNSGSLPYPYTIDTLMREHDSKPRNKLIAQVFYLAGFIEN